MFVYKLFMAFSRWPSSSALAMVCKAARGQARLSIKDFGPSGRTLGFRLQGFDSIPE